MEFDKSENSHTIHEKISDKSTVPCKEPDKDGSSPQMQGGQDSCEEDNALYDYSDDFESGEESDIEDNAEAPTMEHILFSDQPSDLDLPSTVTVLETDWGSRVYIVGTAHFSLESQEDVAKTIKATQPNVVVVELCHGRINILQLDESTLLEEAKNINLEKIQRAVKQDGFVQGLMNILFLSLTAHLTKELGMAPGGEFRRAVQEARLVPNCRVHLGDRPIHITFKRFLHSLSFFKKLKLVWHLIASKDPISKEDVEKCKQKDLLKEMLTEMTGEYPDLTRVFVEERDIFLANSLKFAAQPIHLPTGRLMPTVVVGVVGIGHVPGIVDVWKQNEYDIRSIMIVPEKSLIRKFLGLSIKAGFIGLVSYGCFQLYKLTRSV
ncbi:hypothetical protein CHS0354_035672 [Potamilus streckersoni]|uniref:TraB domain-containing protein n=1 Tax=Potamilus streckersoni TaxID=2493646 RepID=A0AAE0RSK7_9BIVA|nr:hypothetical protein CHS0354_035672 [Potamilus streckersoni]